MNGAIITLSPVLFLLSKLSVYYVIENDILRARHSKTYIRKNSQGFIRNYFLWGYKNEIPTLWFAANFLLGVLTIIGLINAVLYAVLWAAGFRAVPKLVTDIYIYLDIALSSLRVLRLAYEKLR